MRVLVVSPRVAPGILTLEAWDALRDAERVVSAEDGPHVDGIRAAGIDVEVSAEDPSGDTVWIAPPGDLQWARDLAGTLVDGEGPTVEIVLGSHDLPGARLLDLGLDELESGLLELLSLGVGVVDLARAKLLGDGKRAL